MTAERETDPEATVKMPRPIPEVDPELEEVDPEQTLVREDREDEESNRQDDCHQEDWESTVIRRVAPHLVAVQNAAGDDPADESRYGWESESLRRLSKVVHRGQ